MDTEIRHSIGQESIKEKDSVQLVLKDTKEKSLGRFENSEYLKLILTRTEKLTSALYLVSNLISDNEPLKWTARKLGVELIEDISSMEEEARDKGQGYAYEKVISKIFGIISLLETSWIGGLVSKMNFEILKKEYSCLIEILEKNFHCETISSFVVPQVLFSTDNIKTMEEKAQALSEELKKTEDKFSEEINKNFNTNLILNRTSNEISYKGQVKDNNKFLSDYSKKPDSYIKTLSISKPISLNNFSDKNKIKRHETIVSSLKSGMSYTVPEILKIVGMGEEISEKTIQRDLLYMVSVGTLKKIGERRWSRYSLAQ